MSLSRMMSARKGLINGERGRDSAWRFLCAVSRMMSARKGLINGDRGRDSAWRFFWTLSRMMSAHKGLTNQAVVTQARFCLEISLSLSEKKRFNKPRGMLSILLSDIDISKADPRLRDYHLVDETFVRTHHFA